MRVCYWQRTSLEVFTSVLPPSLKLKYSGIVACFRTKMARDRKLAQPSETAGVTHWPAGRQPLCEQGLHLRLCFVGPIGEDAWDPKSCTLVPASSQVRGSARAKSNQICHLTAPGANPGKMALPLRFNLMPSCFELYLCLYLKKKKMDIFFFLFGSDFPIILVKTELIPLFSKMYLSSLWNRLSS